MYLKSSTSISTFITLLCFALSASQNITTLVSGPKEFLCDDPASTAWYQRQESNAVPQLDDVTFELRSPCKGDRFAMSAARNIRQVPGFNVDKKTVVVITLNRRENYMQQMAEAFHCRDDYNFLAVNTSTYLSVGNYVGSAINVMDLGDHIATGLQNLGIDSKNIHLIGLGLGAHTAGIAGIRFTEKTGQNISRITGLDPAQACFSTGPIPGLKSYAATFVDVIHTTQGDYGFVNPLGHADFYPGGLGMIQPGCDERFSCSHTRAIEYFIESVIPGNANNFMAAHCSDGLDDLDKNTCAGAKLPMGIDAYKGINGIFNVPVMASSPYGGNATTGSAKQCEVCSD